MADEDETTQGVEPTVTMLYCSVVLNNVPVKVMVVLELPEPLLGVMEVTVGVAAAREEDKDHDEEK